MRVSCGDIEFKPRLQRTPSQDGGSAADREKHGILFATGRIETAIAQRRDRPFDSGTGFAL